MFKVSVKSMLYSLVPALLKDRKDNCSGPKQTLVISLDLYLDHYNRYNTYQFRKFVHILYDQKPNSNKIAVYYCESNNPIKDFSTVKWEHDVTHDLCWRDLDFLNTIYFAATDSILDKMRADGIRNVKPKDIVEHTGFSMFNPTFTWLEVKRTEEESLIFV